MALFGSQNVSIDASTWTAVTAPSGVEANRLLATTRDGANFLVSPNANGSNYVTVRAPLSCRIPNISKTNMFYVKGTSTTTLEILYIDDGQL